MVSVTHNKTPSIDWVDVLRGQIPGGFGPGGYGASDLDPFGRNTRGGGLLDSLRFQNDKRLFRDEYGSIDVSTRNEVESMD